MKIIAYYLPQFHEIPENNEMWGKGFTEWTNVKKALPLFEGHEQPVSPLNENYYDLLDPEVMKWQCSIAQENGIYGFCFYHYWYNGHKLLEKPILNFLNRPDIDMPFCICWANHDWTTSWADGERKVIFQQNYDDRSDWDKHFEFLLPFLKDPRYIRIDNKPLLVIYEAARISQMNAMLDRWSQLAKENGIPGIVYAYQCVTGDTILGFDHSRFTYDIEYQPMYVRELVYKKNILLHNTFTYYARKLFPSVVEKGKKSVVKSNSQVTIYDYDDIWEKVLSMGPVKKKSVAGAFVKMDTTPRIKERGIVTQGMTPDKFENYLYRQIIRSKKEYKKDMLFLFAWNEWAEGGYLEPDTKWGYAVLNAIKNALNRAGEFPE